MSWQITTGPSAEPVTVAEVKARLRLDSSADDATIGQNITSARVYAEKIMNQSLVSKSYVAAFDRFPFPVQPLVIPMPPLRSVESIKYMDFITETQLTWSTSEYVVSTYNIPGLIKPAPGFTYPNTENVPSAVLVAFTAGPNAGQLSMLADVYEGIRQLAVHIYEHPEAVTPEGLKEAPLALRAFFNSSKVWSF